ncbi:hypothetical protein K458DRAFT_421426 [Lentithecium fluviatile CBS 122367]|uniref:Mid2 domain-containing protein n=1 Tax=Lentithecium fluviatile CBS 122367 TaxID=1168545 RepID=A0A6G1IQV7_9PLEO|nr:hypothetical protein K458DRAFT_421426 [Lentithecium fluviatile CBS 122367]
MLALFFLLAVSREVSGYCYTRNGTTIKSEAYQPCNKTTPDSQCCGTNHSGAGDTGVADDVCESSGLCQNFEGFDGTNEGQQLWWRGGCTDPTWQSPYCLKDVCNGTEYATDNAPVINCGGNAWCCGDSSCCDDKFGIFQLAETVGPTSTSTSSTPTPTPTSSTSTTPTPAPAVTTSPAETTAAATGSSGLSTGAKAGIGVGAAVLVILAIAVVFLVIRLKKTKKEGMVQTHEPYIEAPMGVHEQKFGSDFYAHNDNSPVELIGGQHAELPAKAEPQELHAGKGSVRGRA